MNKEKNQVVQLLNDSLKQEDINKAVLYNLNAIKIDQEILIKKSELNDAKTNVEKQQLILEIAQLENDSKIEYQRSLRNEKETKFNQQFPDLNIITGFDLNAELNEIKLREAELQYKINQSKSDTEKKNLKDQEIQLTALKSEIETKLVNIEQKMYFEIKSPEKEINLELSNQQQLRLEDSYLSYISERQKYNQLVDDFEKTKTRNQELRNELLKKLKATETNNIDEEIISLATQLKANEALLINQQSKIENQTKKLDEFKYASSYEWLIDNKLMPLKRNEVISSPQVTNFSIVRNNSNRTLDQPLPVNVNTPSGLVYRVQVGAFRKPIPNEAFRDFSPVSGDLLANGLTCYMAGYFNSANSAVLARKEIRALGYADAFIVAYCDGKRISFAQGRELENSGRCKSLSVNELNIALQQNNVIPTTNSESAANTDQVIKSPQSQMNKSYDNNELLNSRNVETGEIYQHLFFTVQVGVYNKPINENQLVGIQELITFKTDKGQIRYSSGRFDNIDEAKLRRAESVSKGVTDAFVVAYYEGKRITLAEANNLIAKKGSGILKSMIKSIESSPVNMSNALDQVREIQMELPLITRKIENDSLVQYSLDCNQDEASMILERLNRVGVFTYQPDQNRIVSAVFHNKNISNIQKDYFREFSIVHPLFDSSMIVQLDVTDKMKNGAFADWLLRSYYFYELEFDNQNDTIVFFPENEIQRDDIIKKADELLISIKK